MVFFKIGCRFSKYSCTFAWKLYISNDWIIFSSALLRLANVSYQLIMLFLVSNDWRRRFLRFLIESQSDGWIWWLKSRVPEIVTIDTVKSKFIIFHSKNWLLRQQAILSIPFWLWWCVHLFCKFFMEIIWSSSEVRLVIYVVFGQLRCAFVFQSFCISAVIWLVAVWR